MIRWFQFFKNHYLFAYGCDGYTGPLQNIFVLQTLDWYYNLQLMSYFFIDNDIQYTFLYLDKDSEIFFLIS